MTSFQKNQWYMFVYRNLTGIGSFVREDGDYIYMLVRMNTAEYILPVHKIHTFHAISRIPPECFASIRKLPSLQFLAYSNLTHADQALYDQFVSEMCVPPIPPLHRKGNREPI